MKIHPFAIAFLISLPIAGATADQPWVSDPAGGALVYKTQDGNRIMDFSRAGYGGGVRLPVVPVKITLKPGGGDDTAQIQAAIDQLAAGPVDANGFRGAVLLSAGNYQIAGSLHIDQSGIVLRGAGSGLNGTCLMLSGDPRLFLRVGGAGKREPVGSEHRITDALVPAGADRVTVDDASGLVPGDTILVRIPMNQAQIHLLGMDDLHRGAVQERGWRPAVISSDRVIAAINGNTITLDTPLPRPIDPAFTTPPGASVVKYAFPGRIAQCGVEGLRVVAPVIPPITGQAVFQCLDIDDLQNGWVRDVAGYEFSNAITVGAGAKWVTLAHVHLENSAAPAGVGIHGAPAHFTISGSQVLLDRCSSTSPHMWFVVTQGGTDGPGVVLDFDGRGEDGNISPHQHWATGILFDNVHVSGGDIMLMNRSYMGSGQGWAAAYSVLWNCVSSKIRVDQPEGAANWAIGCTATAGEDRSKEQPGYIESLNAPVKPDSLYLAQLRARLGEQAVENVEGE